MSIAKPKAYLIFIIILFSHQWALGAQSDSIFLPADSFYTVAEEDEDVVYDIPKPYASKEFSYASNVSPLFDTTQIQVLKPDPETLKTFKEDPNYNYYQHKLKDERSFWDYIVNRFFRWWLRDVEPNTHNTTFDSTIVIIGIALVIALIVLIYIYRPTLFFRNRKRKLDYMVEEETIYGMDFTRLISAALQEKDYTQAIRWKYLQILKVLQDLELINWNPNKTVIEYAYELKDPDTRALFRELSTLFLYFRYGNFEAREEHFREVERLSDEIKKLVRA